MLGATTATDADADAVVGRMVLMMERATGVNAAAFLESRKSAMIPPFDERFDGNGVNIYWIGLQL